MKKLLLFLLTGILGTSVNAQELRFETDKFKYIPKGAKETLYDIDENGTLDAVWWDKNRDGVRQDEEIFVELNEDGIPDMPYPEFKDWYEEQLRKWYEKQIPKEFKNVKILLYEKVKFNV